MENYLVFQPICRYFKRFVSVSSSNCFFFWKSKGFYDGNITPPVTPDYSLTLKLSYIVTKRRVEFSGSCLKQDKIMYTH